jgi:hypothetical protein
MGVGESLESYVPGVALFICRRVFANGHSCSRTCGDPLKRCTTSGDECCSCTCGGEVAPARLEHRNPRLFLHVRG